MTEAAKVVDWMPCAVVFISTASGQHRDIMTGTAMFVSEKESLIVISIAKNHLTEKLINQTGRFTLAIASETQQKLAAQLGSVKGETMDKYDHFAIQTIANKQGEAIIPANAASWMACQVVSHHDLDNYTLVIGKVEDYKDLGNPPLVWQKNSYFALKSIR